MIKPELVAIADANILKILYVYHSVMKVVSVPFICCLLVLGACQFLSQ